MFVRVAVFCGFMLSCPAVLAGVNGAPDLFDPVLFGAVGQANVTYDVDSGYVDPEGHNILSINIDGVTGAATAGVNMTTHVITLTPNNPSLATAFASPYVVGFTVCDDGTPSACAQATMTVRYNDPPVLSSQTRNLSPGQISAVIFTSFFTSTGVLHGDNPSDGDTDGIGTTLVSSSAAGSFSTNANLASASSCSVTGTDSSDVTFNAGNPIAEVVVTCYVRVCEELPVATLNVCSVTTIAVTITPPPQLLLKDGFENIE